MILHPFIRWPQVRGTARLRLLPAAVVLAVLLAACTTATQPRDLSGVPLEATVLYVQQNALHALDIQSGDDRVLAATVRQGCMAYVPSPDGSRVAYQQPDGGWWVNSTAGGTAQQVTAKAVPRVSWLPSSQGVYYNDGADIKAVMFDQSQQLSVLPGAGQNIDAATWSRDGTHIAFVTYPRANVADVKVAKADGSDVRSLGRILLSPLEITELCSPQVLWSPDNTRFILNPGRSAYIFYLAGGTPLPLPPHGPGARYTWAPDGSQLAFYDGQGALWAVSAGGTGLRNIDDASGGPAWSADGNQIAYVSLEKDGNTLRTLDLRRNISRVLVQAAGDVLLDPQWLPDGQVVLFLRRQRDGSSAIWTASAVGSGGARRIADGSDATLILRPSS